ncbi:MAG: hypothetical protein REH79_02030 [Spiroplasma sp.]|nr:hypothetical protein [Spiroplasma sp.]
MAGNSKNLRIAAILSLFFSFTIILFAIIFPFMITVSELWVTFFIILGIIESFTFLNSILFCLNPKKRVFISGIISLFALIIPGIIILIIYFNSFDAVKNYHL